MASISDELSGQAKGLEDSISFFTIQEAEQSASQKQLPEVKESSTSASYSEYLDSDEFERF